MSKITIHDVAAGTTQTRDMTSDEESQLVADAAEAKAIGDAHIAKENKKKSGRDKLIALGLTSDEVTALIGSISS